MPPSDEDLEQLPAPDDDSVDRQRVEELWQGRRR